MSQILDYKIAVTILLATTLTVWSLDGRVGVQSSYLQSFFDLYQ